MPWFSVILLCLQSSKPNFRLNCKSPVEWNLYRERYVQNHSPGFTRMASMPSLPLTIINLKLSFSHHERLRKEERNPPGRGWEGSAGVGKRKRELPAIWLCFPDLCWALYICQLVVPLPVLQMRRWRFLTVSMEREIDRAEGRRAKSEPTKLALRSKLGQAQVRASRCCTEMGSYRWWHPAV